MKVRVRRPALGTVYYLLAFTAAAMKVTADHRTHATHDKHSQRCACLSQCSRCTAEALRAKREEQA